MLGNVISPHNEIITNSKTYNTEYNNTSYSIQTNTETSFIKNRVCSAIPYDNSVITIESAVSYNYTHNKTAKTQLLECYNVIRITPKTDITNYKLEIKSYYVQEHLDWYSNLNQILFYVSQNNDLYGTYVTQFLNMTTYDQTKVDNVKNSICTISNLEETVTQDNTNDILNMYGNVPQNEFQTTLNTPLIMVLKLYYYNNYNTNTGKTAWNDNSTFLYKIPGNLQGSYKWTIDTDAVNNIEIVDIPGLLLTMLGMPFAFISQAFDLTVFPGTPYAVNLSHIFLAIICAGILIFIIKKVLK